VKVGTGVSNILWEYAIIEDGTIGVNNFMKQRVKKGKYFELYHRNLVISINDVCRI
jgi:hypothetical protein